MNRKRLLGILLAFAAAPALAFIQPLRINFQGKLINPSTGNPQTGPVSLTFNLYNVPTGGSTLFTETQSVTVTNGVFSVEIGTITTLSREIFLGASVYLGVTVVGDAGGEMLPRQNLVMSAYAFTANQLSDVNEVRLIAGPTYSTFTSAGNFSVPAGVAGSSGSFVNGVTASSGTFLINGISQFSVATASGVSVGGTGGVFATFFSGMHIGDGSNLTGVNGALSGGKSGYIPSWTGATTEGLSNFWESGSSDTALGSTGFAVLGSTFSVGFSSFVVSGGSATVAYGLTASSATLTAKVGFSLTTSSGILVNNGTLDVNAGGGIANTYGIVTGTLTVTDNSLTVGVSSFTVGGGSVTIAYGLTASSATLTAKVGYSLTTSSGILVNNGTLDVNAGGGITNTYGLTSATGAFTTWMTASSVTVTATGGAYDLTVSSGILMSQGTLTVSSTSAGINAYGTGIILSTIDFTGQTVDPNGNAGYMYYNTSTGSIKVFDGSGQWNYVFGQSLSRAYFVTTTNSAAIAVAKPAAASIVLVPFYLTGPMMVRQMQADVTTSFATTGDIGIYTSTGGLVLNGGASSMTTGAGLKTVTLANPHFLAPGQYYAAITYNAVAGRLAGDTLAVAGLIPGVGSIAGGGTVLPISFVPSGIANGTIYFLFEMNP